jgi:hypothetical protein
MMRTSVPVRDACHNQADGASPREARRPPAPAAESLSMAVWRAPVNADAGPSLGMAVCRAPGNADARASHA